ncbi:MAG: site-specific DNA-methyltransferase, partial [Bacteroidota bacterium]
MREEFRQLVIEALRRGEELPPEWAKELFPPEKREYELTYYGKEREEEIISSTMAVPLQPVRTFGHSDSDWHNMLVFGDNLQVMKRLVELKKGGQLKNSDGTFGVRLVYIDPPFSTSRDFRSSNEEKAYQDKILGAEFIEFLRKRLIFLRELLSDDGVLFLHLDTKKSHYLKVVLDEIFGESNFRNEIVWKRQSAHSDSNKCGAIHDTILFYSKSHQWVWNDVLMPPSPDYVEQFFDQVEAGTNRRYARGDLTASGLSGGGYDYEFEGVRRIWRAPRSTMERYSDEGRLHWPKSKNGVPRLKRYLDEFEGVSLQDIWTDLRVIHNRSRERVGYPTQKPETLVERIVRSCTNPGDIVMDVFAGSGTTAAVSEKLGRRWVSVDSGKLSIYTIQKRMLNLSEKIGFKGKPIESKPFILYNAGLYDFSALRHLPWQDWKFFALQLFDCRDEPHSIGGLNLDGKKQGASVLVFNHLEHPYQRVDEETIYSIHNAVGSRIGDRFFIIAPRNTFDFQQDYIDFEGTRYYALRIPYSFINELHHREFSALLQPHDEGSVNDIVDAVGFDFVRPPQVEWLLNKSQSGHYFLKIRDFQSRAYIRGKDTRGGLETLSMVMVDLSYDDEIFDLDTVYYGHQLQQRDWKVPLSKKELSDQIMVVFIDIY